MCEPVLVGPDWQSVLYTSSSSVLWAPPADSGPGRRMLLPV